MPGSPPDAGLFVQLMMRHQEDLIRFVLPLAGSLEDARDVVQEAAVNLWRKFSEYDPAQPFRPWAKSFARYAVLMHHRKRRRFTFLTEELIDNLIEHQESEDDRAAGRRRAALDTCLGKLPEADRKLLERRYRDRSATLQQTAGDAGVTANVLYKALGRIRKQLLTRIERRVAAEDAV